MKIKMINLYWLSDEYSDAWLQKVGDNRFRLTWNKNMASELTPGEAEDVLKNKDWYCKQYNAEDMCIV